MPDEGWDVASDLAEQLPKTLGPGLVGRTDLPFPDARALASGRTDEEGWIDALDLNGFQVGLERYWFGVHTYAAVEVLRFGSHAGALGFQHWIIHGSCVNATRVFAVDDMPGSVGLQLIWGNQDVSEQVSFVRGPNRYLVSIRAGEAPLPWWVVDETARLGIALGMSIPAERTPCSGVEHRLASIEQRSAEQAVPDPLDTELLLPGRMEGPLNDLATEAPTTSTTLDPVPSDIRDEFDLEWRERLAAAGFRDGARRHWNLSQGEAIVTVEVFATHQDALTYQRWVTANVICSLAIATFEEKGISALGFRVWLGSDLFGDEVSFVRGNVLIEVVNSAPEAPGRRHLLVGSLARTAEHAATAMIGDSR